MTMVGTFAAQHFYTTTDRILQLRCQLTSQCGRHTLPYEANLVPQVCLIPPVVQGLAHKKHGIRHQQLSPEARCALALT